MARAPGQRQQIRCIAAGHRHLKTRFAAGHRHLKTRFAARQRPLVMITHNECHNAAHGQHLAEVAQIAEAEVAQVAEAEVAQVAETEVAVKGNFAASDILYI